MLLAAIIINIIMIMITSTVSIAEVGEPPDVTESHGKAETGEEEL